MDTGMTTVRRAIPWNKGKLPGQKPPAEVEESLDWIALREQTAVYVDRILRGADPARLLVEHPTKYELPLLSRLVTDFAPAAEAKGDRDAR